ncbi:MAG: hypothetical protein OXI81_01800 [Paracoccaceae bacterium]|nr:hypothetical protein [Paracoccaceae bacterium]
MEIRLTVVASGLAGLKGVDSTLDQAKIGHGVSRISCIGELECGRLEVPFPDAIEKTLLIQQTEFFPEPKVRIAAFGTMSHGSAKPGKPTQGVIPSTGCGAFALFKNSTVTKESVSVPIFCRS